MTKLKKLTNPPTAEEIFEGLIYNSPYRHVAVKYFKLKGIEYPDIGDLLEAYHELAKVDHRVNKPEKEKKDEIS